MYWHDTVATEKKYYLTKNRAHKFLCEYWRKLSIYMHFTTFLRPYAELTRSHTRANTYVFCYVYSINGTSAFFYGLLFFSFFILFRYVHAAKLNILSNCLRYFVRKKKNAEQIIEIENKRENMFGLLYTA